MLWILSFRPARAESELVEKVVDEWLFIVDDIFLRVLNIFILFNIDQRLFMRPVISCIWLWSSLFSLISLFILLVA